MLFTLGQRAIALLLKGYFRQIEVQGSEPLNKGPLLIAGNHPNMALDPLLLLGVYRRPLFFLANSTLFLPDFDSKNLQLPDIIAQVCPTS
jgi:1-acyl-sn-glycerol-3-phosphate acyltransferase